MPDNAIVLYCAPPLPLYNTTLQVLKSVPLGPAISIASPASVPELS